MKDANCNVCLPCWKSFRQWRRRQPRFTPEDHEGAGYHQTLARDLSPELFAEVAPMPGNDEAAAERELLRLCFVHAKDAAWAQWFYEEVYSRPGGKVAALAFYRAWEAQEMARP